MTEKPASPSSDTFDYEDENGSSHVKPCPRCGAGTDESCEDDCPLVTGINAPTRDPSLDLKMMSGWPVAGVTLDPRGPR